MIMISVESDVVGWLFCGWCVVSKNVHEELSWFREEFNKGYFDEGLFLIHIKMGIESGYLCMKECT